jgi:hypothetical protein
MLDRLIPDTSILLIGTLFLAFIWWSARLDEITYEGHADRLPKWMQAWNNKLQAKTQGQPSKAWRWLLIVALLASYAYYLVHYIETPVLVRLCAVAIGLAVFGACIYYCDKKMGK